LQARIVIASLFPRFCCAYKRLAILFVSRKIEYLSAFRSFQAAGRGAMQVEFIFEKRQRVGGKWEF